MHKMENRGKFEFSIQSLLTEKEGRISGPMSPTLFAKEMAEKSGFKYNRLARLWFADESINQCREDGGLTGHDTLLIGTMYSNDLMLGLWVDAGIGGVPIALAYRSDGGEVFFTEIYPQQPYVRHLTKCEVKQIMQSVFDDPTQINIKA